MENVHYFSLLCFSLSVCANIMFIGIVYSSLKIINESCGDDLEVKRDFLFEIYRVNKPPLLKRFSVLDFYVVHGGVTYYIVAIVLSTIILYDSTHSFGKLAIHTVLALVLYKIIMSVLKLFWKVITYRAFTPVFIITSMVSCILTILLILNLIVVVVI